MAIIVRKMRPEEGDAVRKLGKRTFEWFESLFVPNPKDGFVAYEGDDLLGAVLYKYYQVGDKKIGYVDYVFVDKKAHGKGVGSRLISACVKQMWEDGCLVYQGWSNNI